MNTALADGTVLSAECVVILLIQCIGEGDGRRGPLMGRGQHLVREQAGHIAGRIDPCNIGLRLGIDLDLALTREFDTE